MITIYWSLQMNVEGRFEALALKEIDDIYAVNVAEFPFDIPTFETAYDATQFITQTQKPLYYKTYGAGYELVFVEPNTDEWADLIAKWQNTADEMHNILTPWYVKLWLKIKGAFSSSL